MVYVFNCCITFQLQEEEGFADGHGGIATTKYSKIWPFRKTASEWCYQERQYDQQPSNPGLLFVKVPKTASSTLAGINIRIAHKVGQRILVATEAARDLDHQSEIRRDYFVACAQRTPPS